MADPTLIEDLGLHSGWIPTLARWHFDQWGPLTGARTCDDYAGRLENAARGSGIPSILIALRAGALLGSVSLVASDMSIRPSLTPWLAQLFVAPSYRRQRVGAALVRAAVGRTRSLGFPRLHLYTSGDLPRYYEGLGWVRDDRLEYLGRQRVLMHYDLAG